MCDVKAIGLGLDGVRNSSCDLSGSGSGARAGVCGVAVWLQLLRSKLLSDESETRKKLGEP